MDFLWSPWRMKYIKRERTPDTCIFCKAVEHEDSSKNLIVKRGKLSFVILNRYPYTSGHVMVVPYAHVSTMDELEKNTLNEIMALIRESIRAIDEVYKPDGYNLGANLGSAAGAGIAGHMHFHVVPRWEGDTNFMTSVGKTRVLPEDLCETYDHLKDAWPK